MPIGYNDWLKGFEVAIDRAVAKSRILNHKMVHISEYNIGYSDFTLDIATDTGRYLLHKGLDSEVVIDKAAIYVVTEVRHRG